MITTLGTKSMVNKNFIQLNNLQMEDYDLLKSLLQYESVSGMESEIAAYVELLLTEMNFDVKQDGMGNIYATRGISDNYPLMNAHLDIVNLNKHCKSKSYVSTTNSVTNKNNSKNKQDTKLYNSLVLDSFNYNSFVSKDKEKEDKIQITNTFEQEIDVSEEEAIKIWNEKHSDLSMYFFKEFLVFGFTCSNCVNGCKKYKLCGYFAPNDSMNTKKRFAAYVKKSENIVKEKKNSNIIQESFDLDNNMKTLAPIKTKEKKIVNLTNKSEKYIIKVDLIEDKISGSGKYRVLGGDDKVGVFMALKIAEKCPDLPMKILFTVEEETGCNGVKYFVENNAKWLGDVKYSLTVDRRDTCHLLWSQKGTRSCSNDFAGELIYHGVNEGIPVRIQDGGSADVVILRDYVPNAVNMSAGYFKPHTSSEYIVPSAVDKIFGWIKNIVQNV